MVLAKITGSIVSTVKNDKLVGYKFMIAETIENGKPTGKQMIAVDGVGAGIGEEVLIATGSGARLALDRQDAPVDAAIVGIVDKNL